jgi:hypothetical protein
MRFTHSGALPPLPSRPNRSRPYCYSGSGLAEGVLLIDGDQYLIQWDAEERAWLLAKQTGEAEVYCSRPERCTCWGSVRWGHCKHRTALAELAVEFLKVSTKKLTVYQLQVECGGR